MYFIIVVKILNTNSVMIISIYNSWPINAHQNLSQISLFLKITSNANLYGGKYSVTKEGVTFSQLRPQSPMVHSVRFLFQLLSDILATFSASLHFWFSVIWDTLNFDFMVLFVVFFSNKAIRSINICNCLCILLTG